MATPESIDVRIVPWADYQETLTDLRHQVFIEEQAVPEALEWDGLDPECRHFLATIDGEPVGTARLAPTGQIGRMAVLVEWRGRGIGAALMRAILADARARGFTTLTLNAQTHAVSFYKAFGFKVTGDEFEDAGIPHRQMTRTLNAGGDPHAG